MPKPRSDHAYCAAMRVAARSARVYVLLLLTIASALLMVLSSAPLRAEANPPCDSTNLLAGKVPVRSSEAVGNLALLTDGRVTNAGAPWDDEAAVVLRSTASLLIYDLGAQHSISALYVQADANDVYPI